MGFKQSDLTPPGAVSPITPASKNVRIKAFQVSRSDTTASVKAWLPANASILDATVVAKVGANPQTGGTVSVGLGSVTNNLFNAQTVTAAGVFRVALAPQVANVEGDQPGQDIAIRSVYTESGTASTTGGPFTVLIYYVD